MLYWRADRTTVEKRVFLDGLSAVLEKDEWIIDGNYASTLDMRMAACDTVVFLDYATDVCLSGIKERRGQPRDDIPWVETEDDAEFIEYVRGFNESQKPLVLELISKYSDKNVIVFRKRAEADEFLSVLDFDGVLWDKKSKCR